MTASLNPSYMLAPNLQTYFVDKDSGLPLSNGAVYFYKDTASHSIPKPIFEIVSAAPGGPYTYNQLPNPMLLSAVGTMVDQNGADIIPYYYPFDINGNVELYFIAVYDSGGGLQFTREAWPNFISDNTAANQDITNFVPNGQFLANNRYTPGTITGSVTQVAPGGWTFERPVGDTSAETVTFVSEPDFFTAHPAFAIQIERSNTSAALYTDLRLSFPGVNTFANDKQFYNFYFEGYSTSGSDLNGVQLFRREFYGTGGNPTAPSEVPLQSFSLKSNWAYFNYPVNFPTNPAAVLGTNGDDCVQLIIRFPVVGNFKVLMGNFCLTINQSTLTSFPPNTSYNMLDGGLAGSLPIPAADGANLYLPVVLGQSGLVYDSSIVGQIVGKMQIGTTTVGNELFMNGQVIKYGDHSPLGIPYARLGQYLIDNSPLAFTPMWGTGTTFVTIYGNSPTTFSLLMNSSTGSFNAQSSGFTTPTASPAAAFVITVHAVPSNGLYWSFTAPDTKVYNVYYQVGATDMPPAVPSGANIKVVVASGAVIADVINETLQAVNKYQYAIFDARGYFLRGLGGSDPGPRLLAALNNTTGINLGSTEAQAFLDHVHNPLTSNNASSFIGNQTGGTNSLVASVNAIGALATTGGSPTGGNETRPINLAVNWFIKY
jgi:hypothetical protein